MNGKNLFEAFQALEELDEDVFTLDANAEDANELKDFVSQNQETDELENIIDPLATTDEELQDSYVGKVILDCVICQSKIYKDASEVTINEDGSLANVGEECPFCQSADGYKVIGEVAPYSKTEVDVEVTPKEDGSEEAKVDLTSDEENKDDEGKKEESLKEDINELTIDTDKETINVSATKKAEDGEEMITPVNPETESKFDSEEGNYQDVDFEDFDEEEFDELGEGYLRRVYENVASYKTIKGKLINNKLKLEGIITFKSGKQAKTNFIFEGKTVSKNGKLKFFGENKQFARGNKSFTLIGKVNKNKLIAESLTYNYRGKDAKTGLSKRLYGTVRN
ncbi:hypothetical protein [uncultured Clostridium sp.]|uniref:hypothetical protein n=1 Tax=uncultured Clostridium sp. TaxID=59620 RepID=UPI002606364C|nr:hypothetical protein [uncultured Clostridium sp.]